MKYLLFICADDGLPSPEDLAVLQRECPRWVEEMNGRGVRLLGRELDLPETAVTVRVRNGETLVSDGPFADTKEFIAGFDIIECADLDEALEVAAKHPSSWFQAIEVRPFRDGLELGEKAQRFARGEDPDGTPYCLMFCLDGIPAAPDVEQAIVRDSRAWGKDMDARGLFVFGHPVEHKNAATTIRVRDGETLISDGPFAETHEFIGGVTVLDGVDREQAIELAAAHPLAAHHMVEVRPFYSE
ncbi:MAG TPA: YciI family protein [Solirubrobacteraceae bacterium]|nr:YciI family protein [Solirubrobacteraceae bacterium]